MKFREHRLRIARYCAKNLWLLLFPLFRGITVLKFDLSGIYRWVKGAWLDIVVILVILIYGYIQWRFSEIILTDKELRRKKGIIFRTETLMPIDSISSAAVETLFFLIPFKAVNIRLDTGAGFYKSADMKLLLTKKEAEEIMKRIPDVKKENSIKDLPKSGAVSIILFSFFFSSGFSGAVYIAAFFLKGGDIARDIVSLAFERVTRQAEMIYTSLLSGIPKAAAMTALLFVAAWLVSFVKNLLMYACFSISADRDFINVAFGILKRCRHRIRILHINYIDLRQNLIMKIGGAVAVNISCPGYGYDSHFPVLLPMSREKKAELFGTDGKDEMKYRPVWTSFFSYTGAPLCGMILTALLYHFSDYILWDDRGLWKFLAIAAYIPLGWFIVVKTAALFISGITIYSDRIVLCSVSGTIFHTVIAERRNAAIVQIKQNIIQQIFRKCSVVIWFTGETPARYKVKGLWLKDGIKISEMLKCNNM